MSVMEVSARLTEDQRALVRERFFEVNPRWRGTQAEDILDALDNEDGNLAEVEEAWRQHPALRGPDFGTAVRALVWSGQDVTDANLRRLLGQ